MDKVKKILGRLFIVLFASVAVANVAKAAGTASADVQITIEAPETIVEEINDKDDMESESVQTGDSTMAAIYIAGGIAALAVAAVCLLKKNKNKAFMMLAVILVSAACMGHTSHAANSTENVNVTVPTSITVVFTETGTTSVSDFEINNQSLVPITIDKINVTECNDWKLVTASEKIPVNTKSIAFIAEGNCLQSGENVVNISIPEASEKKLDIQVRRGAWTTSDISETALNLEFEYTIGVKTFQISFDANGGTVNVETIKAYNGDEVTLPEAERDGYIFKGWQDDVGNLYTSKFVMPIGNVKLTAKWQETDAYAVYSEDDCSLTFYRSETPISVGEIYNEKTVTAVYTGFEDTSYTTVQIPWRSYNSQITKIEFHDKISPINTDDWFNGMQYVNSVDVTKLDASKITSMRYTFSAVGCMASELHFVGIEDLDVSNVKDMFFMFYNCGGRATKTYIGDLSKWDVSNVTTMCRMFGNTASMSETFYMKGLENWDVSNVTNMSMMFHQTGMTDPNWTLDLSGWNVNNVSYHVDFNVDVESKVTAPKWAQ